MKNFLNMKTILVDAVNTFVIKNEGIFDAMFKLLEKYPNPKIILTNADDEQMEIFGLNNMPYQVFTLKHNPDKIDPQYYNIMLKNLNLNINDVVYFEHNQEAVNSARLVGINTFHYNQDKKNLIELKFFLDENL